MRCYMDYNATCPLRPESREAMIYACDVAGNSSSVHHEGRAARVILERARVEVARLAGTVAERVIFLSGATEANNTILRPHAIGCRRELRPSYFNNVEDISEKYRLVLSPLEHKSVLEGHSFGANQVSMLTISQNGIIDMHQAVHLLEKISESGEKILVSLMLANNETGAIQPVAEMSALVHKYGGLVHCDAVQAAGRIKLDMESLGVDALSLSSHKIGGPAGAGALIVREGLCLDPLIRGGGQESYHRAGTENIIGIAGFGAAASVARQEAESGTEWQRLGRLRDRLEEGLLRLDPEIEIFSSGVTRLSNTSNFGLAGIKAETAVIDFDLNGIALSSGSACSSGKVNSSHVLQGMNISSRVAEGALRVSLGYASVESDIDRFLSVFGKFLGCRALPSGRG